MFNMYVYMFHSVYKAQNCLLWLKSIGSISTVHMILIIFTCQVYIVWHTSAWKMLGGYVTQEMTLNRTTDSLSRLQIFSTAPPPLYPIFLLWDNFD